MKSFSERYRDRIDVYAQSVVFIETDFIRLVEDLTEELSDREFNNGNAAGRRDIARQAADIVLEESFARFVENKDEEAKVLRSLAKSIQELVKTDPR